MSNQEQGGDKNSMQLLWGIFGTFFIGLVAWWLLQDEIKTAFIWLKKIQLWCIYYVLFGVDIVANKLGFELALSAKPKVVYSYLESLRPANLNKPVANYIALLVGNYMKYPLVLLSLFMGYKISKKNVSNKFKKKYNTKILSTQEQINWPQIRPVMNLDLVETPLEEGPWAMSMTPVDFCKKYNLISIGFIPPKVGEAQKGPTFTITLDEPKAHRLFESQLGRAWNGPKLMPAHRRALLAVFVARGCRDTESARDLVSQLSSSAAKGRIDITGTEELLEKHKNNREVQYIFRAHAYEFTLMTSMLLFARTDGVLPTSDFIWLKPLDRRLWYVLNSVGRQTPSVEGAAAYSHWLAEKSIGRALTMPYVKTAVQGLKVSLNDVKYTPDPEEKEQLLAKANERSTDIS